MQRPVENFAKYKSPWVHLYVFLNGASTGKTIAMSETDEFDVFLQKVHENYPLLGNDFSIYLPSISMTIERKEFFKLLQSREIIVLIKQGEQYRGYRDQIISEQIGPVKPQSCCLIS